MKTKPMIRREPLTARMLRPLARLLRLPVRPVEFYAALEIPYPEVDRIQESLILSRTSSKELLLGRLKESHVEQILYRYFPDIMEDTPSRTRVLPETVWFSISFGLGTRGDEAQATFAVATDRFDQFLPLPIFHAFSRVKYTKTTASRARGVN